MNPIIVHLEGRLRRSVPLESYNMIVEEVRDWILNCFANLFIEQEFINCFDPKLNEVLERLVVTEVSGCDENDILPIGGVDFAIHLYYLQPSLIPEIPDSRREASDDLPSSFSSIKLLPSAEYDGLWESLAFERGIKDKLLHFMTTLYLFGEQNVSPLYIGFNRLILLHGPPGSGKTTLSKALAQKLSIRLSTSFTTYKFIQINSHSLFSKFFSESGKLVGKFFDDIFDMLADPKLFVVVLIDEVETLICQRKAASNEPIDSLRVVNALLTALDKLRSRRNVVVISTSNLLEAMDGAFLDRVDVKMFVDTPQCGAAYTILRNSFNELIRAGIIVSGKSIPCATEAALCLYSAPQAASSRLWRCAEKCTGFSGRMLAKLPILMHASYIQRPQCALDVAMTALEKTIADEVHLRFGGSDQSIKPRFGSSGSYTVGINVDK